MPDINKEVLISEKEIAARVSEIAKEISVNQNGRPLTAIGVLKGSFIFLADLVRQIKAPVNCEFIRVTLKTGEKGEYDREITYNTSFDVEGKDILIVEDILDTGITLNYLINHFRAFKPASIRICTLLDKKESHKVKIKADYVGFDIPNKFVVGYGLDYEEKYRELPYIAWIDGVSWPLAD